jgi:periplasmic protein CpxP/Spy
MTLRPSLRPFLAATLIAATAAFALPAAADARPMHGGGGEARMLRGLDLTQEQRDQAFKIFHEQAPALRERMNAVRTAQQELRKAAAAGQFDSARVRELADAAGKAHAEAAYMRAETMSRVAALLTPEQRAQLESRMERRGEGRHGGHGRR